MAKDKRGGRSLRQQPYSEYDVIGTANNGRIKVIRAKAGIKNPGVPLFSNSKNTVYFIADKSGNTSTITSIAVYRNRQLTYNIDIDPIKGNHYHKWQPAVVRGKSKLTKRGHYYNLSSAQQKLVNMADNWNNGGN